MKQKILENLTVVTVTCLQLFICYNLQHCVYIGSCFLHCHCVPIAGYHQRDISLVRECNLSMATFRTPCIMKQKILENLTVVTFTCLQLFICYNLQHCVYIGSCFLHCHCVLTAGFHQRDISLVRECNLSMATFRTPCIMEQKILENSYRVQHATRQCGAVDTGKLRKLIFGM